MTGGPETRNPNLGRAKRLTFALWLGSMVLGCSGSAALGQATSGDAIRVESNEVLVPAVVLDKRRVTQLKKMNPYTFNSQVVAHDFHAWENTAVANLGTSDFQVLEDGQEQKVDRVSSMSIVPHPLIRDNLDGYRELVGTGGGKWIVPDWAALPDFHLGIKINPPDFPGYLIGYFPQPSPAGSCHQVTVTVNRRSSLVYARSDYCNSLHSTADPLEGTKLGKQLEGGLVSVSKGKLDLSMTAFAPFPNAGASLVHLFLDFPSKPVRLEGRDCYLTRTFGLLGIVYRKDGTVAARFSDLDRDAGLYPYFSFGFITSLWPFTPGTTCAFYDPSRYEAQISLLPGEYVLRAVLSDGKKFGRAEMPLTVDDLDGKHLAVSTIALAKRYRRIPSGPQDALTWTPTSYAPLVSKEVEVIPTAVRSFSRTELFYFYFQVYEPESPVSRAPDVEVHLRIVDVKTGDVKNNLQPISATPYSLPGNPVVPISGGIDIGDLPKGSYRLEVQATDSSGASTAWRTSAFSVQ